jgi:phage nucleotide-binding protein
MPIKFTTTQQVNNHIKALVYGESGIGKTFLASTAPTPLIISAESGLLSLQDYTIAVIEVKTKQDIIEVYNFIMQSEEAQKYETVVVDSISDIAENVLLDLKKNPPDKNPHPQAAYGHMGDFILPMIKNFRDIPEKHVYFIAKTKRVTDEYSGITSWMPSCPGQQIGNALPYEFDFVLPMRIGETEKQEKYRYLQSEADFQYIAKDRSGRLSSQEAPDLNKLFQKALQTKKGE